ncbi:MAG: TolC family protein, partial [Candidatus Eremiobacteraeota bacterium]|nr:TolC family protein [Candidatus Eremiobacteraeota bacterium]
MIAIIVAAAALPVFANLSLADAQQMGTARSVDVVTARATVQQREADLAIARGTAVPHLFGEYSLSPQAGPLDTGTVEQHYFAVGAGVTVNDFITSSSSVRVAAGELLAAQRNADAAQLSARENVARLYYAALQAVAMERFRAESLAGAQRDRAAAELRARSGDAPELDVVRADVTVAQAHADLARAESERAKAIEALASATGVEPDRLKMLNAPVGTPAAPPAADKAIARALASRPELAALMATIQARDANVTNARQLGLPTATVSGGYQTGVDTGIPVQGPQVAARLDVPLSSGTSARVASARAQLDAAYAALADQQRKIALEVSAALHDVQAEAAAADAADRARDEARRALQSVEIGYREGASSSLDVADARRTYAQASADALVAE